MLLQYCLGAFLLVKTFSWKFSAQKNAFNLMNLQQITSTARDVFVKSSMVVAVTIFGNNINPDMVMADARLNAPTAAGTRVNSDAESLLRYGLPIDNKDVRDIQTAIEAVKMDLKGRRTSFAINDVNQAKRLLLKNGDKIVSTIAPKNHQTAAKESLRRMIDDISPLLTAIDAQSAAGSGSIQERKGICECSWFGTRVKNN